MSPEPNGKSANYGCSVDNLVSIINTSHILVRGRSSWQTSEGLEQETNPCMDGGLLKFNTLLHEPLWDIQPSIRRSLFYRLYWNRMQTVVLLE